MEPMIDVASREDIVEISFLGKAFLEETLSSQFLSYDTEGFRNYLTQLIESGTARVWVARDADNIVGAICLLIGPNVYNPKELISDVYFVDVLPEYQRQGIGGKLLDTAEDWAKKMGIHAMTISLWNNAPSGVKSYTKVESTYIKRLKER